MQTGDHGRSPSADKDETSSESSMFERPVLKSPEKRREIIETEPSHTFEKPVLKSKPVKHAPKETKSEPNTGMFQKPDLKKRTSPAVAVESKDVDTSNNKGVFSIPALRKTGTSREVEKGKIAEKPDWLEKAANKQSKVLDVLHAKGE